MLRILRWIAVQVLVCLSLGATIVGAEAPERLAPGIERFEAGDPEGARRLFEAGDSGVNGAWIDYYLGRIELGQGDNEAALERLNAASEADPKSSLFILWLGKAYVRRIDQVGMLKKMGVAKKAQSSLERAVELAPDDYEAREALMDYYLNAPSIAGGSRDKAMEQATEMVKRDAAKGHLLMGRIRMEEEDWEVAVREYRAAVDAGEQTSSVYYWLGFAAQQLEDWDAAFDAFEMAIEVDKQSLPPYYQFARTAIFSESRLGQAAEFLIFYIKQPQQDGSPAAEHAHWRLGMIYELQDRDDLAATEYREALELDPKHEEAKKALAALGSN